MRVARFQIVEDTRSFLLFRLACAAANAVPIVAGAFGLFAATPSWPSAVSRRRRSAKRWI
jgi:hypothetical protein